MERKKVYITVKTYPTISKKYDELVCTAGFLEDGSWIRLYPLPFRKLYNEQKYKKYQWIEADVEKSSKDYRSESYKVINRDTITVLNSGSNKVDWNERKKIVFQKEKIYTNLSEIIELTKKPVYKSLVIFKPTKIVDFSREPTGRDWPKDTLEIIKSKRDQYSLFQTPEEVMHDLKIVPKLPYVFKYQFQDDSGKKSNLMIEDWEIGMLYINCLKNTQKDESRALEKVKQQCWEVFMKKDLYFFLGTRLMWHGKSQNPFSIVGVFYPPKNLQNELF